MVHNIYCAKHRELQLASFKSTLHPFLSTQTTTSSIFHAYHCHCISQISLFLSFISVVLYFRFLRAFQTRLNVQIIVIVIQLIQQLYRTCFLQYAYKHVVLKCFQENDIWCDDNNDLCTFKQLYRCYSQDAVFYSVFFTSTTNNDYILNIFT